MLAHYESSEDLHRKMKYVHSVCRRRAAIHQISWRDSAIIPFQERCGCHATIVQPAITTHYEVEGGNRQPGGLPRDEGKARPRERGLKNKRNYCTCWRSPELRPQVRSMVRLTDRASFRVLSSLECHNLLNPAQSRVINLLTSGRY